MTNKREDQRDCPETHPVALEVREQILDPFIKATTVALRDWANTEMVVLSVFRQTLHRRLGDLAAMLHLQSRTVNSLTLSFPQRTAEALARRILAGSSVAVDQALIRDCLAETVNVIAGQAKALLHGTPHHFVFFMPIVLDAARLETLAQPAGDCLLVSCDSDLGPFTLQVFVDL